MMVSSMDDDDAVGTDGEFVLSLLDEAEILFDAYGGEAPGSVVARASNFLYDADGTETNGDPPTLLYLD